jgi:hypothetical protein
MNDAQRTKALADMRAAESAGLVADSMTARLDLVAKVKAGDITVAEAQKRLRKLRRTANENGKITQRQAFMGRLPGDRS